MSEATSDFFSRRSTDAQLRYLSQATFLEEAGAPRFLCATALIASASVGAFLTWAAFTQVDEISRAPGEVVPSGFEQNIQHLDGGLVQDIRIKVGDLVEKDQILVTINDGQTRESLARSKQKLRYLQMSERRIEADITEVAPDFSDFTEATPAEIKSQIQLFNSTMNDRNSKRRLVNEQIEQKKKDIDIIVGSKKTVLESLKSFQTLFDTREKLYDRGLIAYPALVQTEQEVIRHTGQAAKLSQEEKQGLSALAEQSERLTAITEAAKLESSNALSSVKSEIQQLESTIDQLHARMERLVQRAPVRGLIKELHVNTIGSVLKPGQDIVSIVPVDEELVVEAQVLPSDIGHIVQGQPVHLKISAYDFSRYGIVDGTLERISATTFSGSNGQRYYKARIKLEAPYVGQTPGKNPILPGMTVTADILTGNKTILDYLLKPVKVATASAFTER